MNTGSERIRPEVISITFGNELSVLIRGRARAQGVSCSEVVRDLCATALGAEQARTVNMGLIAAAFGVELRQ